MKKTEIAQGEFIIEFPEDMDAEEIDFIKTKLFKFLERHSCKITKKESE